MAELRTAQEEGVVGDRAPFVREVLLCAHNMMDLAAMIEIMLKKMKLNLIIRAMEGFALNFSEVPTRQP